MVNLQALCASVGAPKWPPRHGNRAAEQPAAASTPKIAHPARRPSIASWRLAHKAVPHKKNQIAKTLPTRPHAIPTCAYLGARRGREAGWRMGFMQMYQHALDSHTSARVAPQTPRPADPQIPSQHRGKTQRGPQAWRLLDHRISDGRERPRLPTTLHHTQRSCSPSSRRPTVSNHKRSCLACLRPPACMSSATVGPVVPRTNRGRQISGEAGRFRQDLLGCPRAVLFQPAVFHGILNDGQK